MDVSGSLWVYLKSPNNALIVKIYDDKKKIETKSSHTSDKWVLSLQQSYFVQNHTRPGSKKNKENGGGKGKDVIIIV